MPQDFKYFDKFYLSQYLDSGMPIKVLYNNNFYNLLSFEDLKDNYAVVSDTSGKTYKIYYKGIKAVKVAGIMYDIDMLNKPEEAPDEPNEDSGDEGDDSGLETALNANSEVPRKGDGVGDDDEEEDAKESTIIRGDLVENVDPDCLYFKSKGVVIEKDDENTVRYRVFTSGMDYRMLGNTVTKKISGLKKL